MSDWTTASIGELTSFLGRGKSPVYADDHDPSTMPVLNQACVQNGRLDLSKLKFVTKTCWDALPGDRRLQSGDVIINSTGTGTLGRVGYWNEAIEAAFDSHVTVLRFHQNHSQRFFYHLLTTERVRSTIEGECTSGSTNQVELMREPLRRLALRHPVSLDEQAMIARVLTQLDQAIGQTEALLAKQQRIKTGLMHDLLTRGLDALGRLRDPSTHRFKPSRFGPIPVEWNVSSLESQKGPHRAFIRTGPFGTAIKQSDWQETGVPVITIGSLGDGKFDTSALQYLSEEKAEELAVYRVEAGDLLFSRVADVGRAIVVTKNEEGWLMSSNLMRISLDLNKTVPAFVHLMLLHPRTADQTRQSVNSSGRDVANTAMLCALQFAWPSFEEQTQVSNAVATLHEAAQTLEMQVAKLHRLKRGLMDDLLTARVPITPLLSGSPQ